MLMENTTTEEKYKKLAYLFEKYKGHKFKTFENVLMYCQKTGDPSRFTIKPHIHWYYDNDENRYVLYDPSPFRTILSGNLIPLEGNEELIGFKGETEVLRKYAKEVTENETSLPKNISTGWTNRFKYLEKLTVDDLLSIIKYGLRDSDAPSDVTVEDIYYLIQSNPL